MLEKRTSQLEQQGGKLVGYAAVYAPATSEDLGGFRERIHPGAFDASLEKNADIRALWDHNTSQPLARTTNNTLRLSTDKRGLRVEIELPEGVEMVMPGDNIQMTVELIHPIAMDQGLRFAIREGGRTVGAGVVAKIIA